MHIDLVCGWAVLYGQAAELQPQHPRSATACQAARHCHMAAAVEQAACCWCHAAAMQAARGITGLGASMRLGKQHVLGTATVNQRHWLRSAA
jgi:hypothetical protein